MASYILGKNPAEMSLSRLLRRHKTIEKAFPTWPTTKQSVSQVLTSQAISGTVDFAGAAHAIQKIGEQFGHWEDLECQKMKGTLMNMEDQNAGRVRLDDFYGRAPYDGKWQFEESVPYLRELGALDESNPKMGCAGTL